MSGTRGIRRLHVVHYPSSIPLLDTASLVPGDKNVTSECLDEHTLPHPGLWYSPQTISAKARVTTSGQSPGHCATLTGADQKPPMIKGKERSLLRTGIYLSHNGDFDRYDLFDHSLTCAMLGEWLSRVLHQSNALQGDSPKIAGMIELLHVKATGLQLCASLIKW